ncbi:MAG: GNAT family N-acetyltransferase [Chloroflexi bacterium]|nr:GNAT family N-acetyltransferase [Chloroflexota bacterium]
MRIVDLRSLDDDGLRATAGLLVEGFRAHAPDAWPTLEAGLTEVREALANERLGRVAVDAVGTPLGWVGAISQYDGRVWELHPLVVAPGRQGQGLGRALVQDLEARVRELGGITLWAGADDEDGRTSLANVDLYQDLPSRLANVENPGRHPYGFYQRLGFTIVGVMPDANGPGKPDIFVAKRVGPSHRRSTGGESAPGS